MKTTIERLIKREFSGYFVHYVITITFSVVEWLLDILCQKIINFRNWAQYLYLDIWMCQDKLSKRWIEGEAIYSATCAQHQLQNDLLCKFQKLST